MAIIDPDNPHRTPERPWTAVLIPNGLDIFNVPPDQLREVTVSARCALDVQQHPAVRRLAITHYLADAVPAGSVSTIVRQIFANARRQADAAGRQEWEDGKTGGLVRGITGARPLGG